ncbi:hypothetical protein HanHA89_Chr04g0164151 [Helianthus annuus]|nr:hypothetical protein HanHA89_Chr04g0164151 [Helianthus annuus]
MRAKESVVLHSNPIENTISMIQWIWENQLVEFRKNLIVVK